MKILHITPRLHIGGAEIIIKDLAILAKKAGHDVTILTYAQAKNHIVDELNDHQIHLIQPNYIRPIWPLSLLFCLKHLNQHSYNVIHTHMPLRHKSLVFINHFKSKKWPLLTTEHVDQYLSLAKHPIDQWTYKQYRKVISCSKDMQSGILQHIPTLYSKCAVVHNGVDSVKFSQQKSTIKSPATLQAVTLARLDKQKDLVTCIKAFSKIKSNIHLSIVGDGKEKNCLIQLIEELNLKNKVTLLGWKSDIPALLSNADMYIQSSRWEGFSIGVLEAMSMALPMIVSNAGGLQEAVGNAGFIFPIGDSSRLASHLDRLAQDASLRAELSQKSLSRVKQFSLDNMWDKYYKQYCEVANIPLNRSHIS